MASGLSRLIPKAPGSPLTRSAIPGLGEQFHAPGDPGRFGFQSEPDPTDSLATGLSSRMSSPISGSLTRLMPSVASLYGQKAGYGGTYLPDQPGKPGDTAPGNPTNSGGVIRPLGAAPSTPAAPVGTHPAIEKMGTLAPQLPAPAPAPAPAATIKPLGTMHVPAPPPMPDSAQPVFSAPDQHLENIGSAMGAAFGHPEASAASARYIAAMNSGNSAAALAERQRFMFDPGAGRWVFNPAGPPMPV